MSKQGKTKSISKRTGIFSVSGDTVNETARMIGAKRQMNSGPHTLKPVESVRVDQQNKVTHINGLKIDHH